MWIVQATLATVTAMAGGVAFVALYPAAILNAILNLVKQKKTGAFDLSVSLLQYTVSGTVTLSGIVWKNAHSLGYQTPCFARVGAFTVAVDWASVVRALLAPATNPIVVRAVDVSDVEVFIEKTPPSGNTQAPSMNLWAALGAANDGDAATAHTRVQQHIAGAASGAGLDVTNLLGVVGEGAAKLATPERVVGLVDDLLGAATGSDKKKSKKDKGEKKEKDKGDKKKTKKSKKGEEEGEAAAAAPPAAAPATRTLPYTVTVERFQVRGVTLHVAAYFGTDMPPVHLPVVSLDGVSTAGGGHALEDLVWLVVGQVMQQLLARNPLLAAVSVLGSGTLPLPTDLGALTNQLGALGDAVPLGKEAKRAAKKAQEELSRVLPVDTSALGNLAGGLGGFGGFKLG
jgi:hypothetical protein